VKLPRDVSGTELAGKLEALGYRVDRQAGSHLRLTTKVNGEHHVTIPAHAPLKLGTLNAILRDIAAHHGLSRDALLRTLFGD
jgi:predicted RNA binding protein YcfA (HicA-like mRNA interferase family)